MKLLGYIIICLVSIQAYADLNRVKSLNTRVNNLDRAVFDKNPAPKFWEVSVAGEFLYWQTMMTGDIYALSHNIISAPEFGAGAAIDTHQKTHTVRFEFNPAFRIWANTQLPFDDWNLKLIWTRLRSSASSSVSTTSILDVHTLWDSTNAMVASTASGKMHERFDVLDLNFGKTLLWSGPFTLSYYVGAKGAIIEELFTIFYGGTFASQANSTETIQLKNRFSAIGLNNGLRLKWCLGHGLSFYGRGEAALLWGRFNLKFIEDIFAGGSVNRSYHVNASNPIKAVRPNFVAEAGFNWKVEFSRLVRLSLFAGYEFNYWTNQIVWNRHLTNDQNLAGGVAYIIQSLGDLGFHGINAGASLTF